MRFMRAMRRQGLSRLPRARFPRRYYIIGWTTREVVVAKVRSWRLFGAWHICRDLAIPTDEAGTVNVYAEGGRIAGITFGNPISRHGPRFGPS